MKVPKYQRQTSITSETGGRMLSVQADANVFSAPGRTAAQAGQQMFKAGLQWYGHELKLKRASELFTNEQAFQAQSAVIKEELNFGNPEKGIAPWDPATRQEEFKRRTIELRNSLSFNIKDKTVKTRFETAAQSRYLTDSLEVMKQTRVDLIDQTHASFIEEQQFLEEELSKYIEGTPGYIDAYNKLFGADEIKKDQWVTVKGALKFVKGQKQSEGLYERMARLGIIDNKEVPTKILKSKNKIAKNTVRREMVNITTEEEFDTLLRKLNTPEAFVDLAEADRTNLIQQAQKAKENLINKINRVYDRELKITKEKRTNKHNSNFAKFRTKISAYWRGENENVTREELDFALDNDDISSSSYKTLITAASNGDALSTDPTYYMEIVQKIIDADTSEELDELENEILKEVSPTGKLQRATGDALFTKITSRREKTPEHKKYVFHRNSLDTKLKNTFNTSTGNKNLDAKNSALIERGLVEFEKLVNDPDGPLMDAEEAAEIAFKEISNNRLKLVPIVKPNVTFTKQEPSKWSYTDVRKARIEMIQNFDMGELERQLNYLKEIEEYLDSIYGTEDYVHGQDKEANLPPISEPKVENEEDLLNKILDKINIFSNEKDNVIGNDVLEVEN